jgi:hypothetical protein
VVSALSDAAGIIFALADFGCGLNLPAKSTED